MGHILYTCVLEQQKWRILQLDLEVVQFQNIWTYTGSRGQTTERLRAWKYYRLEILPLLLRTIRSSDKMYKPV